MDLHDARWVENLQESLKVDARHAIQPDGIPSGHSFHYLTEWWGEQEHLTKDDRVSVEEVSVNSEQSALDLVNDVPNVQSARAPNFQTHRM